MFFRFVNLLLVPKEGEDARGRGGDGCEAAREGRGEREEEKAIKVTSTAARRPRPGSL